MGRKAIEILDLDVNELLKMLNEALAEEWLAYYQYWIGARIMEGPMRNEIESELLIHANEELGHAVLIADRIIQLGGIPLTHPQMWETEAKCAYHEPNDPYVEMILEQNLKGERCAINRYKQIADFTVHKDYTTYEMAIQIMNEEIEHEEDLESFMTDLERFKENIMKLRM